MKTKHPSQRSQTTGESGTAFDLSTFLERILAGYQNERANSTLYAGNVFWSLFKEAATSVAALPAVSQHRDVIVKWSMGQGVWAKVPWLALLDARETRFTNDGVYLIYLFRMDMSGVYLTFNQGVSRIRSRLGGREARLQMRRQATELRRSFGDLSGHGFSLDDGIQLRADHAMGEDYEAATVGYKLYRAGEVPPTSELVEDLEHALDSYVAYVGRKH